MRFSGHVSAARRHVRDMTRPSRRFAHQLALAALTALAAFAPAARAETTPAESMLATLRAQSSDFERCFVQFAPNVESSVTLRIEIASDGYGRRAFIVEGDGGLDTPGLCLVDQFLLRPGVRFTDQRLRGHSVRAQFVFTPTAQPRLAFRAP
jgi:hypothetical protein